MLKWIEFNLKHPKLVVLILVVVTALSLVGIGRLYFDTSTEAVLPKEDISYKILQRSKKVFGDSKTFITAAIEPDEGEKLLSERGFQHIAALVMELEEFKTFNAVNEDSRLNSLLDLGNVKVAGEEKPEKLFRVEEVRADSGSALADEKPGGIWDLNRPLKNDFYAVPLRGKRVYDYENYRQVRLGDLIKSLDPGAQRQLHSILRISGIQNISEERILSKKEYRKILEQWEMAYLYKSMEIIKQFMNPISGQDIEGTDDELRSVTLIGKDHEGGFLIPKDKRDFARYREKLEKNPAYESTLYSVNSEGEIQALAMNLELRPINDHGEIFNYIYQVMEKHNDGPLRISPIGLPVYKKFVRDYMENDLFKLIPFVIFAVIITFFLNFRSLRGVVLPLISVVLGSIWTLGVMGFFGVPLTLVVNLLPPLLVAVGSSYAIHIYNQYLHDRDLIRNLGMVRGLRRSMIHISTTVMLAALTTFIGFMTLSTNQVKSLSDFGIFAALGTLLAMVSSIMLIPSSLVLLGTVPGDKKSGTGKKISTNFLVIRLNEFFSRLTLKHAKATVLILGIIVVIFAYGITKIEAETSHMYYFDKDTYLYQSDMRFGDIFKGSAVMNLIIDSGRPDGIKDPAFLSFVEELRQWIVSPDNQRDCHMLHTASFGDVVKRMNMAMKGGKKEFYAIPDTEMAVQEYMEIFSGDDGNFDGRVDSLEVFVDPDYRYNNLIIRIGPVGGIPFSMKNNIRAVERIKAFMAQHPQGKKYSWNISGEPICMIVLASYILKGQLRSILLTIVILALIIFVLFRNWKAALLSVIPISTSIILIYGCMGYFGLYLDIPKSILAAITIGIGIDDTIHILKTLRYHLRQGMPLHDAMRATYKQAGMAVIYTSVALIFGFSMFLQSSFVPIADFGWLVTSSMVATTVSALVLLPAVIVLFNIDISGELDWKIFRWINLGRIFDPEGNVAGQERVEDDEEVKIAS